MALPFDRALAFTLRWEGGYVNHPADPGGATNNGITQAVYDRYRREEKLPIRPVKEINDSEVRLIYFESYWMPGRCSEMPPLVGLAHFDACVNHGLFMAAKLLQRAAGVSDDGRIGPKTMAAIAASVSVNPIGYGLALTYIIKRRAFYLDLVDRKPNMSVFLNGWLNRMDALEREILKGEKADELQPS